MATPLGDKLAAIIAENGPISIADYMSRCLADPEHGYYTTRDPLGAAGDFTTAPEISQIFGELIGAWLVHAWRMAGAPSPAILAEAGPGRGTLMADILRTAGADSAFIDAVGVHLVETSPALRDSQMATLGNVKSPVSWHQRIEDVPDGPLFFIANELFDALPIRQFVRSAGKWRERTVGLYGGRLTFGLGPDRPGRPVPQTLDGAPDNPADGDIFETCPAATAIIDFIAGRIAASGGAALIVDYGYAQPAFGNTLQAVKDHAYADPLAEPGEADLTTHVDFAALACSARQAGAAAHGPIGQGAFLIATGLVERAGRLGAGKDAQTQNAIAGAARRLAGPEAMGTLFKVMAITPPGLALPPFEGTFDGDS